MSTAKKRSLGPLRRPGRRRPGLRRSRPPMVRRARLAQLPQWPRRLAPSSRFHHSLPRRRLISHPDPRLEKHAHASVQHGTTQKAVLLRYVSIMHAVLKVATAVSCLLCGMVFPRRLLGLPLVFVVRGTIDEQDRIVHEQWRVGQAKLSLALAGLFALLPLVQLLKRIKRQR